MPKLLAKITDRKLQSITKTTSCGGVPGLIVKVTPLQNGYLRKYFFLRYQRNGSTKHYSIGAYPETSLAEAFKKAAQWRKLLDDGIDPTEELKTKRLALNGQGISVEDLVFKWIDFNNKRGRWKDASRPREDLWLGYLHNHIPADVARMPVVQLTPERLSEVFGEKWETMIDTPERILSDLKNAIDWGMREKLIPIGLNPAQIKDGRLGDLLPLHRPTGGNEPALPPDQMPAFFASLLDHVRTSQAARCLAFSILTAARNTAAREATWNEILWDSPKGALHVIPRERMKVKKNKIPFDRQTPLSDVAIWLLKTSPRFELQCPYVFPNIREGKFEPISLDALTKPIKTLHNEKKKIDGIGWVDKYQLNPTGFPRRVTPHGLARATFNTWAKDATGFNHPVITWEIRESCLDHFHSKYACAYDRDLALGDMRVAFDEWTKFCMSEVSATQKLALGLP